MGCDLPDGSLRFLTLVFYLIATIWLVYTIYCDGIKVFWSSCNDRNQRQRASWLKSCRNRVFAWLTTSRSPAVSGRKSKEYGMRKRERERWKVVEWGREGNQTRAHKTFLEGFFFCVGRERDLNRTAAQVCWGKVYCPEAAHLRLRSGGQSEPVSPRGHVPNRPPNLSLRLVEEYTFHQFRKQSSSRPTW